MNINYFDEADEIPDWFDELLKGDWLMSIDGVLDYESTISYMIHNKMSKDQVHAQFLEYQRHLFTYELLDRPLPPNDYEVIKDRVLCYTNDKRRWLLLIKPLCWGSTQYSKTSSICTRCLYRHGCFEQLKAVKNKFQLR